MLRCCTVGLLFLACAGCGTSLDGLSAVPGADAAGEDDFPGITPSNRPDCEQITETVLTDVVDIMVLIDNSGSMEDEIEAVQQHINESFADILQESGLDYRVIMISEHGEAIDDHAICVSEPLSSTTCQPVPTEPANADRFFHYSTEIGSHDAWCQVFNTFDGSREDDFDLAPTGWSAWLRPGSFKTFVVITDDSVDCRNWSVAFDDRDRANRGVEAAESFDEALRQMAPEHFGQGPLRNYVWHSIVGMAHDVANSDDTIVEDESSEASGSGTGYQALSLHTGGLRKPIGNPLEFDTIFAAIAGEVVSTLRCE